MDCGYLNELSCMTNSDPRGALLCLLETVDASCFRVRAPAGALDQPVFGVGSIRNLVFAEFRLPADADHRRRLVMALLDSPALDADDSPWFHAGAPASGISAAMRSDGLAVSFAEPRWNAPEVSIARPDAGAPVAVKHAASVEHARIHRTWLNRAASPADMLRRRLAASTQIHVPASSYSGGKHVKKATNAGRKLCAAAIGGAGQFLAERHGHPMGDQQIQGWEKQVLALVRTDSLDPGGHVEGCDVTFKVYAKLTEVVGYDGGTGNETHWIRVEYASGSVHSHPHTPIGVAP